MKVLFNDNWQFKLTEIGSNVNDIINSSDWYNVEIPHDWLILDTNNLYKTGEGWYKKSFSVDGNSLNKVYTLIFDGVYMNTTVFVNGNEAGKWKYGYSAFAFDISKLLTAGENYIFVCVRHEAPNTRWYSGAGIFRNIWLKTQENLRIINDGVYFNAKKQEQNWKIYIETEYTGYIDLNTPEARYTLYDKNGKEALSFSADIITKETDGIKTVFGEAYIENPVLWDVENPYLYSLKIELFLNGKVMDTEEFNAGFRETEFSSKKGFILNGRVLKLHGVCMHQDLGALGSAFNINALRRQLEIMHEMGVNSIRTSHNPPARELMNICDEMGLLVDNEAFDMWELPKTENDYARFFPEWYKKDVASWVRRDRNHPCLIMWSIGNEIYDTHVSDKGREVTILLRDEVLKHDPYLNGKVTVASNYMSGEGAQKCAEEVNLAGYNYAENLYDEHHEKYPYWFIYGSETASCVRSRGIYHLPSDTPILMHEDLQCSDMGNSVVGWGGSCERTWTDDRDREYCGGQFIWTGFDYIGEPTPYSTKNSYFGIVDTAGLPKASYYLYKAVWNKNAEPFVKLFPHWDWNEGQAIDVFAYSNLPCAELFLNGVSLGKCYVDLKKDKVLHFSWTAKYQKGELLIKAYDENGSLAATDRKASFSEPVKLIASYSTEPLLANGTDLKFVEISVVDENKEPVENARNRVSVAVKGNAVRLIGLDSGDSTDYDSYQGNNKRLFSGKLIAIFKSSLESGDVDIEITSKGLEKATARFSVLSCKITAGVSIPAQNVYPVHIQETDERVSVRKIELKADKNRTELDKDNPDAYITAKILPKNADFKDIEWKCVFDTGVEANLAELKGDSTGASITAKGDGKFKVRAISGNGRSNPEIISELEFTVKGLGELICNPYKFTTMSRHTVSNYPQNIVSDGAVTGFRQRTVIGFTNLDFGVKGTDLITLYVGNCNSFIPIELWNGNPDENGSELIDTLQFPQNNLWGSYAPYEFKLSERFTGIKNIFFAVVNNCIFGGFKFIDKRAFEMNAITDYDGIYGDDFKPEADKVEGIGNNVLISFKEFNFGENGINKILIDGRTKKEKNTINVRFKNENGIQKTQLLEFDGCKEYTVRTFEIEKLCGVWDFEFVFLPGSDFDFKGFMFK